MCVKRPKGRVQDIPNLGQNRQVGGKAMGIQGAVFPEHVAQGARHVHVRRAGFVRVPCRGRWQQCRRRRGAAGVGRLGAWTLYSWAPEP